MTAWAMRLDGVIRPLTAKMVPGRLYWWASLESGGITISCAALTLRTQMRYEEGRAVSAQELKHARYPNFIISGLIDHIQDEMLYRVEDA